MGAAKDTTHVSERIHPLRYVLFTLAVICSLMSIYVFLDFQTSTEAKLSGELILGKVDTAVYPEAESPIIGFFFEYVGVLCYGLSLLIAYVGYFAFIKKFSLWTLDFYKLSLRILGFNLLVLGLSALFSRFATLRVTGAGGLLGDMLNLVCNLAFPPFVSILIFVVVTYFGCCLFCGVGAFSLFDRLGEMVMGVLSGKKAKEETPVEAETNQDNATAQIEVPEVDDNTIEDAQGNKVKKKILVDSKGNEIVGGDDFDEQGNVIDKKGNIIQASGEAHVVKKVIRDRKVISPEPEFKISMISNLQAKGDDLEASGALPDLAVIESDISEEDVKAAEEQAAREKAEAERQAKEEAEKKAQQEAAADAAELAEQEAMANKEALAQADTNVDQERNLANEQDTFDQSALVAQAQGVQPQTAQNQAAQTLAPAQAQATVQATQQATPVAADNPAVNNMAGGNYAQAEQAMAPNYQQGMAPNQAPAAQNAYHDPNSFMDFGGARYEQLGEAYFGTQRPIGMQGGMKGMYGLQGMAEAIERGTVQEQMDLAHEGNKDLAQEQNAYGAFPGADNYNALQQNPARQKAGADRPLVAEANAENAQFAQPGLNPQFNGMPGHAYGAQQDGAFMDQNQMYGAIDPNVAEMQRVNATQNAMQANLGADMQGQMAHAQMAHAQMAQNQMGQNQMVQDHMAQSQLGQNPLAQNQMAQNPMGQNYMDPNQAKAENVDPNVNAMQEQGAPVYTQPYDPNSEPAYDPNGPVAELANEIVPDYSEMMAAAAAGNSSFEQTGTVAQAIAKAQAQEAVLAAQEAALAAQAQAQAQAQENTASYENAGGYDAMANDGSSVEQNAQEPVRSEPEPIPYDHQFELDEDGSPYRVGVKRKVVEKTSSSSDEESPYKVGVKGSEKKAKKKAASAENQDSTPKAEDGANDAAAESLDKGADKEAEQDKGPSTLIISSDPYGHSLTQSDLAQQPKDQTTVIIQDTRSNVSNEPVNYGMIGGSSLTAESLGSSYQASHSEEQADTKITTSESSEQQADVPHGTLDASVPVEASTNVETTVAPAAIEVAESAPQAEVATQAASKEVAAPVAEPVAVEQPEPVKVAAPVESAVANEVAPSVEEPVSSNELATPSEEKEEEEVVHTIIQKVDPEVFAAQQAAAAAAKAEAERKARIAREEAERKAKEEAEAKAKAEAEAKAKEEAERKAREEAEAKAKAEAEAKAAAEAEAKAKEEAERKAKEEAEAKAKAEAEKEDEPLYMGTYADKIKRKQKRKPTKTESVAKETEETVEKPEERSVDTVVTRSTNSLTPAPITSVIPDNPFAALNAAREKAEAERKAKEEAEAKAKAEAEAKAKEEAERKAKEEAEARAKAEAEAKAKEEAERKAKEEAEAKAKAEAEAKDKEEAEDDEDDEDSPYITPGIRNRKKKKKKVEQVEAVDSKEQAPSTIIQYSPTPAPKAPSNGDGPTLGSDLTKTGADALTATATAAVTTAAAIATTASTAATVAAAATTEAVSEVASAVVTSATPVASVESSASADAHTSSVVASAPESSQSDDVYADYDHHEAHDSVDWDNIPRSPHHDLLSAEYQKMVAGVEEHGGSISSLVASMSVHATDNAGEMSIADAIKASQEVSAGASLDNGDTSAPQGPSTLITTSDASANKEHLDRFTSSFDPYNPAYVEPSKNPSASVNSVVTDESGGTSNAVAVMQTEEGIAPVSSDEVAQALAKARQSSVIDFTKSEENDSNFIIDPSLSAEMVGIEPKEVTTTIISRGEGNSDAQARYEQDQGSGNTAIYRAPEADSDDGFYNYAIKENNRHDGSISEQSSDGSVTVDLLGGEHSYDFGGGHQAHGSFLGEQEQAASQEVAVPRKPIRTSNFSFTDMAREEEERQKKHDHEINFESFEAHSQEQHGSEYQSQQHQAAQQEAARQQEALEQQKALEQARLLREQQELRERKEAEEKARQLQEQKEAEERARKQKEIERMAALKAKAKENIISFTNFSNKEPSENSYEVNKLTSAFIPMEDGMVSGNTETEEQRELERQRYEERLNSERANQKERYEEEKPEVEDNSHNSRQAQRVEAASEDIDEESTSSEVAGDDGLGMGQNNMVPQMSNQNMPGMQYMPMPNGQYMPMMQQGMPMYQTMPMNGMQYVQMPGGQYVPMMPNNNMLYQQQMLQAQAMQQQALQQQLAQQQAALAQAQAQVQAQAQAQQLAQQQAALQNSLDMQQSLEMQQGLQSSIDTSAESAESYGAAATSSMDSATNAVGVQSGMPNGATAAAAAEATHAAISNQVDQHTMGEHGVKASGLPTAGNAFMGAHNSSSSNLPSYMSGVSSSFNQPKSLSLCSVPKHQFGDWRPGLDLLAVSHDTVEITSEDLEKTSDRINEVLHSYGVKATVADYLTGPVITRFDLDLAPGVKSSAISSIETELCRNLLVPNVRVVPIIEGSSYVGLEVPNSKRKFITLGDMVSSREFQESKASLPMMLGASVVGKPVIKDLAETPHLLVAGTTGSGKSAGLNTMLISLLLKRSPAELRLILVDPKQLEFSIYKDLPHLITPVITDVAEKTAIALSWCVDEMERRFKLMSLLGVRKLSEYNDLVKAEKARGSSIPDPLWTPEMGPVAQGLEPLPWIVVVVEEFADLMAQSARKKDKDKTPEGYIARLTAKSRAAGIHLVLVTQTPRSEVVNGMIKANIPSRIAFTVQNRLDSSIVLDEKGAECLLGNGDMLYKFSGSNTATRAHGSFTSNDDVKRVVTAWREQAAPEYLDDVITAPVDPKAEIEAAEDSAEQKLDVKFEQAAEIAREYMERKNKPPSITSLQNDLGVGFPRAQKIYKQLIREGIIEE